MYHPDYPASVPSYLSKVYILLIGWDREAG